MKLYLTMGELCTELGLPSSTIHYWLRCFHLKPAKHGNKLMFNQEHVARLQAAKNLIYDAGLTLEAVKHLKSLKIERTTNRTFYNIELEYRA